MRGHSLGKVYGRDYVKPYVEFWEQPLWRRVIAETYHRWDMSSWRFIRIFERPHEALSILFSEWRRDIIGAYIQIFKEPQDLFALLLEEEDFYIPLTNRQDLKCDYLVHKGRKTLTLVYITEEQYDKITKR